MLCDKCGKEAQRQVTIPEHPYVVCRLCAGIKNDRSIKHEFIYSNGQKQISRARFNEVHKKYSGHVPAEPR